MFDISADRNCFVCVETFALLPSFFRCAQTNDTLCSGPSLIEYLDGLPAVNRMTEGPVRIPILDRYKVSEKRNIRRFSDFINSVCWNLCGFWSHNTDSGSLSRSSRVCCFRIWVQLS